MVRSSATSLEHADFNENEQPTRRVPVFDLAAESRRLDAARTARAVEEETTLTLGAEENRRLLASVFAAGEDPAPHRNTDDEPTLDAPAPVLVDGVPCEQAPAPRPIRVTARPPALRSLVITTPPPAPRSTPRLAVAPEAIISLDAVPIPRSFPHAAPSLVMVASERPAAPLVATLLPTPPSGLRRRITPQLSKAVRDVREEEDRRRSAVTFTIRLPRRDAQTWVVAGIWAMALSLVAVLMFMASSA